MSSLQIQRHLRQIDFNKDHMLKIHNHIDYSLFGKISPLALSTFTPNNYHEVSSLTPQNRWDINQDQVHSSQIMRLLKQQRKIQDQNKTNYTIVENRRENNRENGFRSRLEKDYLSYAMINLNEEQIDLQSPYKKLGTLGNHAINHFNRTQHQKNYILENWTKKNAQSVINKRKENYRYDSAKILKKANQSQFNQQNIDVINFQQRNTLSNVNKINTDCNKSGQNDALNNTAKFTPSKKKVKFIDQQNSQKTLRVDYTRSNKKLSQHVKQKQYSKQRPFSKQKLFSKQKSLSKQKQSDYYSINKFNGSPKMNKKYSEMSNKYSDIISQRKRKAESSKKVNKLIDDKQSILKKIQKRINCSVMMFEDSELRTKRHQKDHLQMTYQKERRDRQEIKNKINNHPWIIKKYDKVFQIQT